MATEDKKFRLHQFANWRSFYGRHCRIELWRESESNVTPIEILNTPLQTVTINYPANGNYDKHYPLWGATLDFNFYEQTENTAKGIKKVSLDTVVADYEREVRCDYYLDGELVYRGWQAPDQCEDYPHRNNKAIFLTFIDGIGSLENFPLLTTEADNIAISQVSEYGYYGANLINATNAVQSYGNSKESVFNLIKSCLGKTELNFGYKVINDIYEVTMNTLDVRVFEKVFVDYLSYAKDKSSLNCAEVLISIFRGFGLVVYQKNGYWNIVRVAYLESKVVETEVYDKQGVFITSIKYKTLNTLNPYEAESDTPKKWGILEEGFIRISNPPCQYQNLIVEYGEDLIVNNYDTTPWTIKNIDASSKALGSDFYLKINDKNYRYPDALVGTGNNTQGGEDNRRKVKNESMINFLKEGVHSQEIEIYPENEITFSFSGIFKKINLFAQITDQNGVIYHYIPSQKRWINRDLFLNKSAGITMESPDLIASTFEVLADKNSPKGAELNYEIKLIFGRDNSLKGFFDTGKRDDFGFPIIKNVPSDLKVGKLTLILRGGSNLENLEPSDIYLRNIKVSIDQVKETHTFTNAGKVSYKPEDITVLNGDGSGTGYTKSSFFIQKETTVFPYTSKPFPTKIWKDSSHQTPNNLLSFTAEMVVNAYAKRSNIVKAKIRTKQKLWVGDILRMPSYSKLGYGKYLIMPPFVYSDDTDIYDLTLFQVTCDIAKGNTLEYYLDSNGNSIFRNQTFNDGYICPQTFEAEGICLESGFTAKPICI